MNVKQIATIVNTIIGEFTGETTIVQEDLSNIVDVGGVIADKIGYDMYTKALINRIGRTVFVDREYKGSAPDIAVDSWEYGSIMQKVRAELPEAVENPTWSLVKGESIDPFIFNPPEVMAKFYNSKTTFSVEMSFTEVQVKQSFTSAEEMARFFAMIENRIAMQLTLARDNLAMRTIVNLIGEKLNKGKVVSLVEWYNDTVPVDERIDMSEDNYKTAVLNNPDFLRFACKIIVMYRDFIKRANVSYNEGGYVTFTPTARQHLVLLTEFATSIGVSLLANTYNNELIDIGEYDTVPFWQSSSDGVVAAYGTALASSINVIPASEAGKDKPNIINQSGIVGVLFDRDACAICNDNPRVTSIYNPRGEYTNYFYKQDCSYLNDLDENVVVFTL